MSLWRLLAYLDWATTYDEAEEDEVAQHAVDVVRVVVAHVLVDHVAQLPQI